MTLQIQYTSRGFAFAEFEDEHRNRCTIQKSSLVEPECIWLGCTTLNVQAFFPGDGWKEVAMPEGDYIANNRMHLTQAQVAELLPLLQRFVETGEIDE